MFYRSYERIVGNIHVGSELLKVSKSAQKSTQKDNSTKKVLKIVHLLKKVLKKSKVTQKSTSKVNKAFLLSTKESTQLKKNTQNSKFTQKITKKGMSLKTVLTN